MIDIITLAACAVVCAALALTVRRYSPEQSVLISIGSSVVILMSIIKYAVSNISSVSQLLYESGINSEYILILLKTLGICFITEFACDAVAEAGMLSLSSNIMLAGKIIIFVLAAPLFKEVFSVISSLLGG